MTFEKIADDLDDCGGCGKRGSAPTVRLTGGSGLTGGTAWNGG